MRKLRIITVYSCFQGWKKEHVVQEFLHSGSRIVMVKAGDPAYATKKVSSLDFV